MRARLRKGCLRSGPSIAHKPSIRSGPGIQQIMQRTGNELNTKHSRLVIAVVLFALVFTGCALTPEAKEARFLDAGKKALATKDYSRAIIHFQNAVRSKRDDAEPYYLLGICYIGTGDYRAGLGALNKVLAMNPNHTQARLKKAELLASVGDKTNVQDAETLIRDVLAIAPTNGDALNVLAIAEWKLGESRNAELDLMRALNQAPQNLQATLNLAKIRYYRNDVAGAEEIIKRAVAASPKSAAPVVALGELYAHEGKAEMAEQQYLRAVQLDPKNDLALLSLANLYARSKRTQEAEALFRQISSLPDARYKPLYAMFLFQSGKQAQAVTEFEKLAKDPKDRAARTRLIEAYLAVNRLSDAEKLLSTVLKNNPKDPDALLQRSRIYLAAGNYTEAHSDAAQVLRFQPDSAAAHYIVAKVSQSKGEMLIYRQELSEALRLNPRMLPIRLELAQLLMATNAARAALEVMKKDIPDTQKDLIPVLVQRNWILLELGDMAESRRGIDQGLAKGRIPQLLLQDAWWKLAQNKLPEARVSLEEALKINPADVRSLSALARTYVLQNQPAAAIAKIKEYAAQQPKSAAVQQYLGNALLVKGDLAQARAAFMASSAADPKFIQAYLSLAQVDFAEHKWNDARNRLKTVLAMDGKNETAILWLGNIEEASGNHQAAIKYFQQAVEGDPNNAQSLNNLAYLLAEYANNPDEALKYAQKAQELSPDTPGVEDTLGWVLYRKGLYSVALQHLEQAASLKGPVASKYHLAMAYARAGNMERGRATLQAALKVDPNTPEAKMAKEVFAQAK